MITPIYLKTKDAVLPALENDQMRYLVADDGVFAERRSSMFTVSTRVRTADLGLASHREYCQLRLGKISRVMQRAMLGFFEYAYAIHGGEAALVLLYHPERKMFRWHCPQQTVELLRRGYGWRAAEHIAYDNPLELPPGYITFGDAHLHVGSPQPSMMDVRDDQDGLHIIVGNIGSKPSYHVDFVMDETRFRVPPELIFDDPSCSAYPRPPQRWIHQIRTKKVDPYYEPQTNNRYLDGI